MIIKTFTADSAAAALKKVRAELGKDAVVLKTRELPFGHTERMEITACIDKPPVAAAPTPVPEPRTASRQVVRASFPQVSSGKKEQSTPAVTATAEEQAAPDFMAQTFERMATLERKLDQLLSAGNRQTESAQVEQLRQQLIQADLPGEFINELIASVSHNTNTDLLSATRSRLADTFTSMMLPGISFKPGDKVAFIGYAGAGKTSVLGKLAARLVYQEKQSITLVTLDNVKIGAFEELSSYADILGSPTVDYQTASTDHDTTGITLIDTPALPRQLDQRQQLLSQLDVLKPTYRFAIVSAMTRATDVTNIVDQLRAFAPTHLVFTMLDLTDRWGSLIAACRAAQIPAVFVTNAPAGMGTVNTPDPASFTRSFLTTEESRG